MHNILGKELEPISPCPPACSVLQGMQRNSLSDDVQGGVAQHHTRLCGSMSLSRASMEALISATHIWASTAVSLRSGDWQLEMSA